MRFSSRNVESTPAKGFYETSSRHEFTCRVAGSTQQIKIAVVEEQVRYRGTEAAALTKIIRSVHRGIASQQCQMFIGGNILISVNPEQVTRNGAGTLSRKIEVGMMGDVERSRPICNGFGIN